MSKNEKVITVNLEENCRLKLYGSTFIGTRSYQQDRMLMYEGKAVTMAAICDGMGGMEHGERASQTAIDILVSDLPQLEKTVDHKKFLYDEAWKINERVAALVDEAGVPIESGSTIVMAVEADSQLYTMSAGDSRIYLLRKDILTRLTRDHNYRLRLDEELRQGTIDEERYRAEEYRAESLISFLGIGPSIMIDINMEPVKLKYGDMLLLCSDGLYKALGDDEIIRLIRENQMDTARLPDKLIEQALFCSPRGMDNTTVIIGIYI